MEQQAPTPPLPSTIVSVVVTGADTCTLTLAPAFTYESGGGGASSQFTVNAFEVLTVVNHTGTTIDLQMQGGISSGDAWALSSQPSWSSSPVTNPDGGTAS